MVYSLAYLSIKIILLMFYSCYISFYIEYLNNIQNRMSIKKISGFKIFIDRELGRGTYGTVYKGEQDGTGRQCAIKIIDKKKISMDPYLEEALISEIQIMSKLESPNIVTFYDVLESGKNYYIIQELCTGDLETYMNQYKSNRMPEETAIKILTELCTGFLTLVSEGIVHRDLKPANILMKDGVAKIGDFGFAKQNIHKKVKNKSIVGTPLYMSIQLLKCQPYTSKCDIWAIGCIFYELLHGQTPFQARCQYQIAQKIQSGLFQVDPKVSNVAKDFLVQTLKTYQEDRICWDDIFRHKIFKGYFDEYLEHSKHLQDKYKKVMGDLRFSIRSENVDLKKLWGNLNYSSDKQLDFDEFSNFLQAINPNMTQDEVIYFFEKMDANGDGSISLKQLQSQLQKYSINLTSKHGNKIPFQVKKSTSIMENIENLTSVDNSSKAIERDEEFEKKVRNCFVKLNKIIEKKNLTLYKTFIAYDADNTAVLTLSEFSKMLKKLDSSFTSDEIEVIFGLIDEDGSNTIQFDELNNYYCKVNCIPVNMHLPKGYKKNKKAR